MEWFVILILVAGLVALIVLLVLALGGTMRTMFGDDYTPPPPD